MSLILKFEIITHYLDLKNKDPKYTKLLEQSVSFLVSQWTFKFIDSAKYYNINH